MNTMDFSKIDALMDELDHKDAPGRVLAVFQDDKVVYQRAAGMSDLERNVPLTCASVFDIGSTGKQFMAMIIALLEERGSINLNDDVHKYIPELPGFGHGITIGHLLHHTSGLRDYTDLLFYSGMNLDNYYSEEQILEIICRQRELNFIPGEEFLYSNSGYLFLGVIARRISGKSLRQLLHDMIFEPLGMHSSECNDDAGRIVRNRAVSYHLGAENTYSIAISPGTGFGDGPVLTTIGDMFLWDKNFNDNRLGGGQELIGRMQEPGVLNDGTQLEYASGLFVQSYRGLKTIGHSGSWAGYLTDYLRLPDLKVSVIQCSNLRDPSFPRFTRMVADLALDGDLPAPGLIDQGKALLEFSCEQVEAILGFYWNEKHGTICEIFFEKGAFACRMQGRILKLDVVTPTRFNAVGSPFDISFTLQMALPETLLMIHRELGGPVPDEYRKITSKSNETENLSVHAGTFYSSELGTIFKISVQGGQLVLDTRFCHSEPLRKVSADFFSCRYFDLKFFKDNKGMYSLSISNTRLWNLPLYKQKAQ